MFPKLTSKAILSPMAGVTDVAFRALCKTYGCGMTYTEFVSSAAITRGKELPSVQTSKLEKPVAVQLFGNNITEIVQSAQKLQRKFDVIDINCGCPAWKVIKTGSGSALLNNPKKIALFIETLVASVKKPVSIKIRAGIDGQHINAVEVAKAAEQAGASAVAVHGRTQKQGYQGNADWTIIKKVKDSVNIPVIGNGDVTTPEIFKKRLEETGVDAIMIARGAIGNPYLFCQIQDYMTTGTFAPHQNLEDFKKYVQFAKTYNIPFAHIKRQAPTFTKGMPDSAKLRLAMMQTNTIQDLLGLL